MLEAKNCNISINNTGIMAQSVSINSSNSTFPVQSIGKKGLSRYIANGPVTHSVSIDYILNTDKEPNYNIFNSIKSHINLGSFEKCEIVMGGISGSFYLDSYSVSSSPNNLTTAKATYISFEESLSGFLNDSKITDGSLDYVGSTTGFSNGWSTYFYENEELSQSSVYDFSYSFRASWEPSYVMGSKIPSQVDLMEYSESISVIRDIYTKPIFSGDELYFSQDITGNFNGTNRNSELRVYGLWRLCGGDGNFLNFSLSGSSITSSTVNYSLGDTILTETTAFNIG